MIYFVYFVIVVSFIDTMAQLPILSTYVGTLGASAILIGIIMGAYSLSNMLGNLGAGLIIDRYGRVIAIVGGMFVAGIAVFMYAFVSSPEQLFWLRIVHGLGGAVLIPAAFAYLGDLASNTPNISTTKAMGRSGSAVGIAAMLGPAISGIGREKLGYEAVFIGIGILLVVTAFLAWLLLRETYLASACKERKLKWTDVKSLFVHKILQISYLSGFSLMFTMGVLAYALPIRLQTLGFGSHVTGIMFSVFSLVAIVVFLVPMQFLTDKYGRFSSLSLGLLFVTVALAILPIADLQHKIAGLMVIYGCGFGLLFPAMTAIIVDETEAFCRGTTFGIFYAAFSLGVFIGPIVSGIATQNSWQPFWVAAVVLIIVQLLHQKLIKAVVSYE